jgi:hypothetical protein
MSALDRTRRDNQRKDFARDSMLHKLQQDAVIVANEGSTQRVDAKRRMRLNVEEQRERDMLIAMETKILAETNRNIQEEQEFLLARELDRLQHDQTVSEKRRQQLRESNIELRELEAKLKAAYLSKEIHAQRVERQATTRTEREQDLGADREMAKIREREEREEEQRKLQVRLWPSYFMNIFSLAYYYMFFLCSYVAPLFRI